MTLLPHLQLNTIYKLDSSTDNIQSMKHMREYDIWNEVLLNLGYEFVEEYIIKRSVNAKEVFFSIYKKDGESVKLYAKFKTGEVTSFLIDDGWEYYKTFQNKNKELFRSVKLKYDRQSKLDKLGI